VKTFWQLPTRRELRVSRATDGKTSIDKVEENLVRPEEVKAVTVTHEERAHTIDVARQREELSYIPTEDEVKKIVLQGEVKKVTFNDPVEDVVDTPVKKVVSKRDEILATLKRRNALKAQQREKPVILDDGEEKFLIETTPGNFMLKKKLPPPPVVGASDNQVREILKRNVAISRPRPRGGLSFQKPDSDDHSGRAETSRSGSVEAEGSSLTRRAAIMRKLANLSREDY
jgi:hypothetical protein